MKQQSRGMIKKTSDGKWMIDTKILVDGEYKHFKRTGYDSLGEARADFELQKELFIKKHTKHHKSMIFDDMLEEYKKMRVIKVNYSTTVGDNSVYNKYLLPYFSNKLIKDVFNQQTINEWYHNLMNIDYSDNKKNKVITRMKDILLFCYNNRYIDAETYQVCDTQIYQVKYSKKPSEERCIWTKEEENAFLEYTKKDRRDYIMFKTFFLSALRISEFLALQVKCFEPENSRLKIYQQVANVTGQGMVISDKLKSEQSYRTVMLSKEICDLLIEYCSTFDLKDDDCLWFGSNSKNEPMSKNTFRRKLYMYCDLANVTRLVPHEIRHNMAVKLARVCETTQDIEVCASRLGHTPSVFLDIYANHKDDLKQQKLMEKMLGL